MKPGSDDRVRRRVEQLRSELSSLERELQEAPSHWQAPDYYAAYHATAGFLLGMIGAAASLLFNVIGSAVAGQHPLRIIQVYLTFPLGEKALSPQFDSGVVLAIGCCLYLATGMLLGIPFHMIMVRLLPNSTLLARLLAATGLGLAIWGINFYAILSWLQPLLFGGMWIVDPGILPWWVGASTHLVFAWTMAIVFPWGLYTPYHRQTEFQS